MWLSSTRLHLGTWLHRRSSLVVQVAIEFSSSSEAGLGSNCCFSTPSRFWFASLLSPQFRIVHQALEVVAFFLSFARSLLRVATSCSGLIAGCPPVLNAETELRGRARRSYAFVRRQSMFDKRKRVKEVMYTGSCLQRSDSTSGDQCRTMVTRCKTTGNMSWDNQFLLRYCWMLAGMRRTRLVEA